MRCGYKKREVAPPHCFHLGPWTLGLIWTLDGMANNVIENGFDAPSTLLDYCSKEFLEAYKHADLIISKGQGNFEGLMDEKDKEIYFLLMAKCEPIAKRLGVNKGDLVIKPLNQLESVV